MEKILAIKLRAMGDSLLMLGPLMQLRKSHPNAEIHALVSSQWSDLFEGHPSVDRVWPLHWGGSRRQRVMDAARMLPRLRAQNFDVVLNFHASRTSSYIARLCGAPNRAIHFHGHRKKNHFSTLTIPGKGFLKPATERDMDLVRALGLNVPEGGHPDLLLSQEEKRLGGDILRSLNATAPLLFLGPGAGRPTKRWPLERFAKISKKWTQTTGGSAIVIAGPDETDLVGSLTALDPALIPLNPGISLRQTGAALSHGTAFLGNDSGPKHLAIASGCPTVTLFGPEDPFEWHPYPRKQHPYFFVEGLPCRKDADPGLPPWCGLEVCEKEGQRCMTLLETEPVFSALLGLIPPPTSPTLREVRL